MSLDNGDIILLALLKKMIKGVAGGIKNIKTYDDPPAITFEDSNGKVYRIDFKNMSELPYKDKPPTYVEVGGLPKGSDVNGETTRTVQERILWPYMPPTIKIGTVPNISIVEKGTSLADITITADVTRTTNDIVSVSFYSGNTKLHEITKNVEKGGKFTFDWKGANLSQDTTLKVVCDDGEKTVSDSKTIYFVNRAFWGVVPNGTVVSVSVIEGLANNTLKLTKNLKTNFTGTNCHILYAYPASQGVITSIKDAYNFEYIESYTESRITRKGETYMCYLLTKPVSITDVQQDYK